MMAQQNTIIGGKQVFPAPKRIWREIFNLYVVFSAKRLFIRL
jgi:hypothetical protein